MKSYSLLVEVTSALSVKVSCRPTMGTTEKSRVSMIGSAPGAASPPGGAGIVDWAAGPPAGPVLVPGVLVRGVKTPVLKMPVAPEIACADAPVEAPTANRRTHPPATLPARLVLHTPGNFISPRHRIVTPSHEFLE